MPVLSLYSRIQELVESFGTHLHVELQQRGVEFTQLFRKYDQLRGALLERMPPMETVRPPDALQYGDQPNGDVDDSPPSPPLPSHHSVCLYYFFFLVLSRVLLSPQPPKISFMFVYRMKNIVTAKVTKTVEKKEEKKELGTRFL